MTPIKKSNDHGHDINIVGRLDVLEIVVGDLKGDVHDLAKKTTQILDAVSASRTTDWKTLAAWAAVILTIMTTVGNMAIDSSVRPLDISITGLSAQVIGLTTKVEKLIDGYNNHTNLPIHPVAAEQVHHLQKEIDELRATFKLVPIDQCQHH